MHAWALSFLCVWCLRVCVGLWVRKGKDVHVDHRVTGELLGAAYTVDNWDLFEQVVNHVYRQGLQCEAGERPIMIVEPSVCA